MKTICIQSVFLLLKTAFCTQRNADNDFHKYTPFFFWKSLLFCLATGFKSMFIVDARVFTAHGSYNKCSTFLTQYVKCVINIITVVPCEGGYYT